MYTHWSPYKRSGKRALATATSLSILPVATMHGAWHGENPCSLLLQLTYLEVVGLNPVKGKSFSAWNLISRLMRWYPCSSWLSYLTSFQYNLFGDTYVLPSCSSFFFLHLCASCTLSLHCYQHTFLSFCSIPQKTLPNITKLSGTIFSDYPIKPSGEFI